MVQPILNFILGLIPSASSHSLSKEQRITLFGGVGFIERSVCVVDYCLLNCLVQDIKEAWNTAELLI